MAGRPKIQLDPIQIQKLAAMHCTVEEIAAFFDVSRDTIDRNYAENIAKGKQMGKMKLRDMQLQAAQKGNVAMLIFLGKQYLGQSDKVDQEIKTTDTSPDPLKQHILDAIINHSRRVKSESE